MDWLTIRDAIADDARFMSEMLVEAANWTAIPRSRVAVLDDPNVSRYIAGWVRPGDFGSVATDVHGTPIGACWARLFPSHAPGSGFVAVGVPELTLGVNPQWRAQGVGRSLVQAVGSSARSLGYGRLSLSVDRSNYAHRLYVSEGYVTVVVAERADTMVRVLG